MGQKTKDQKFAELNEYIDNLPEKNGSLIMTLHKAQGLFGYLPVEVQNHIAHKLNIPSAKVYGVVTFYSFFNTEKKGKFQINICMGTACFVRGAQDIVDEFERQTSVKCGKTSEDFLFSVDALRCVGACGLAPVISVNGKVYGRITTEDVKGIVEEYMAMGGDIDD